MANPSLNGSNITAYRQTADRIRQDLRKAEVAVQHYQTALDAVNAIISAEGGDTSVTVAPPTGEEGFSLDLPPLLIPEKATMKAVAIAVLSHVNQAMTVRQIYDAAIRSGWKYRREYESFRMSMFPTLTRDEAFVKVARGLYGLAPTARK